MPQVRMSHAIDIHHGPFRATVLPTGATLCRFRKGARELILGFCDPQGHQSHSIYAGAIVGPVANRLRRGQLTLCDTVYQMPRNERGQTTLHSGPSGLHALKWDVTEQTAAQVTLAITLEDGDCGLPGRRKISVTYALDAQGMTLTVKAQSDACTPMNIAHHPYWTLGGELDQGTLQVFAQHYLPKDAQNLPTGEIAATGHSAFDYRNPRVIGAACPLDHNFCCAQERQATPRRAARLTAPDGLTLEVLSTEPGLQVYAGHALPHIAPDQCFGTAIGPYKGLALEPQGWPDAPNNSAFPSIILHPQTQYTHITRYNIFSKAGHHAII